ncbi:hypothetical protein TREES_T100006284 [Tupaia chinensis]|uniref:Uncharacterized protein n=1 Tax=Tupaia chinensis TaxID=246437 RepID=L9L5T0_TUPCH|nr:hypothetical protein TREES_T100006284 [Tupaia chinensis]
MLFEYEKLFDEKDCTPHKDPRYGVNVNIFYVGMSAIMYEEEEEKKKKKKEKKKKKKKEKKKKQSAMESLLRSASAGLPNLEEDVGNHDLKEVVVNKVTPDSTGKDKEKT